MIDFSHLNFSNSHSDHFSKLDVSNVDEYLELCDLLGFNKTLDKSKKELKKERREYQKAKTNKIIKLKSKKKNKYNKKKSKYIPHISSLEKPNDYKNELNEFLIYLEKHSKLHDLYDIDSLINYFDIFNKNKNHWINSWKTWIPKTHNKQKQFFSLTRHLFCKYEIPKFMNNAWIDKLDKEINWFIKMGQGENIRKLEGLPFPVSKKMSHHFSQAPDEYTIQEAFIWGLVHSLNGNARTVNAILGTKLNAEDVSKHDFKISVIRFFIDNPMLDPSQYNPIVDYLYEKKYNPVIEYITRDQFIEHPPEQPNLSMYGRKPDNLLEQVEKWHKKLGKDSKRDGKRWLHDENIQDFSITFGNKEKNTEKTYEIIELLTSSELKSEGRSLKHCVYSYVHSCLKKTTSIWSLSVLSQGIRKKLITIEVRNDEITQMRGFCNRMPNSVEKNIIDKWANTNNLKIGRYSYI